MKSVERTIGEAKTGAGDANVIFYGGRDSTEQNSSGESTTGLTLLHYRARPQNQFKRERFRSTGGP